MTEQKCAPNGKPDAFVDISDQDILEAMQEIPGFLDITADDFKIVYAHAYSHAQDRLSCKVTAKDVMQAEPPFVLTTTTLIEVAEQMAASQAFLMPVLDPNHELVGVITRSDFLACLAPDADHAFLRLIGSKPAQDPNGRQRIPTAADIMHGQVVTVDEDDLARQIVETFKNTGHTRFPVLNAAQQVVGVLSLRDLMRQCLK